MSDRFVEELLARGVATKEQVTKARHAMRTRGGTFTYRLRKAGCDADDVLKVLCAVTHLPRATTPMLTSPPIRAADLDEDNDIWWRLLAVPFGKQGDVLQVAFTDPSVAKEASLLGLSEHAAYLGTEQDVKALLFDLFGAEPEHSTAVATGLVLQPDPGIFDAPTREATAVALTDDKDVFAGGTDTVQSPNVAAAASANETKVEDVFELGTQDFEFLPSSEAASKTGLHFRPDGPFSADGAPLLDPNALEPVDTDPNKRRKPSREEIVSRLQAKGRLDVVVGESTSFFERPNLDIVPSSEETEFEQRPVFQSFSIDDYKVIERLGKGATSEVYVVEDPEGEFFALKLLDNNARYDAQELTRFRRSVKLMRDLEHPAIVPVVDFGSHKRSPYMVQGFFDGGTLKQLMQRTGRLPAAAAVLLLEPILEALSHAHATRIIHRDLKPENVFLSLDGRVAVGDFGIARQQGGDGPTQAGETLGSAPYMAPEQAHGAPVDARTDLWAVGVLLYEMLTGVSPFQAEKFNVSLFRVVESDINEPFMLAPDVPLALDWVVQRLLQKEPDHRFPSARAVLHELQPLIRFVKAHYPTLLAALMQSPATTTARLRSDQGQAELHRVDALLRAQPPQFIEACFAAWRAAVLLADDPNVLGYAQQLAQRFRLTLPPLPSDDTRPPPLREEMWQNAAVHARAMATASLNKGDIVGAAVHLRRHVAQVPHDQHAQAQLMAIVGRTQWAPFPM